MREGFEGRRSDFVEEEARKVQGGEVERGMAEGVAEKEVDNLRTEAQVKDKSEDNSSVLAQVQRYQMRHKSANDAEGSRALSDNDSDWDDSDSDGNEEDDYQVFGRMTIKAQSEAFYQVSLQQKENVAGRAKSSKDLDARGRSLPKFMKRNAQKSSSFGGLKPHIENENE
ncbi:hypothetical protein HOP50_10g57880 [Chloropicon primus]|uniref:Uncharacterized protein n=1 Tax=Chloropicon primus TaxID=1764295 RepID=A0A5B8MV19_9CHLO|nr:hypothetical protein A3770_10p57680 [Chloropicon primus]UPR02462.1 hypothetical protein HOP50_10g57880 [Chloropicon primus]|eukprot:QDZ23250.1 hypothetical protein A3770_10p57680 [Chloropicon primus]